MTTLATATTVYRIDEAGRLLSVNDAWTDFAAANGAPHLSTIEDLGERSLWDWITDVDTAQLYRDLVAACALGDRDATVPFRCDAPDRRRYMELIVRSLPGHVTEFRARLLREELRSPIAALEGRGDDDAYLTVCGWCKRARDERGRWIDLEAWLRRGGLDAGAWSPHLTHSICERCQERVRREIDELRDA